MADSVSTTPSFVDYTSRDYFSLREDLILRIREQLPTWRGEDPADFGVAMVEAFAYMGDVVNYYIDRVANESFLPTATQRQSILNIAANYGYTPAGYRAATIDVQFINDAEVAVTLPIGTELLANVTIGDTVFELIYTIPTVTIVPAKVGGAVGQITTSALNYEDISKRPENAAQSVEDIAGELLGVSNGQPDQAFRLEEPQVIGNSSVVYVQVGDLFEPWTVVDNIIDYGPFDSVVGISSDANDFTFVLFGDGVSGKIPPRFSVIKATYNVGGSEVGNIASNLLDEIYRVPGLSDAEVATLSTTMTVTNSSAGVGGQSPEDNASIKENAPKALTSLNRAVSLNDFNSLALQVPGIGKAKSVADYWTSVTTYVAPQRNITSVDQFPGYTANPNEGGVLLEEWYDLQADVQQFISDKLLIGTTLTVSPPTYVEASIEISYSKFAQYSEVTLDTNILKAVLDNFGYSNSDFNQIIHPEEVEALIRNLTGVRNAKVTALYRTGGTTARGILLGQANEMFVFLTDNISVAQLSSNSNLTDLQASPGTASPTFSPSFYSYATTVPNSTTSITVLGNTQADSSILRINGVVTASELATNIATPVGVSTITFSVEAADGITFSSYVLTVTRNS
jgi:hypothetical protein